MFLYVVAAEVVFVVVIEFCDSHMDSHLLRDSKHWSERVNIFYQIFVNLLTKSTLIYPFLDISSEKKIHPSHVCLSNDEKKRNFSSSSQCSRNITAKSKRSISHKHKYGGILWENTTIKMALRFTTIARTEFNFW